MSREPKRKGRTQAPPQRRGAEAIAPLNLLLLDRFSGKDLDAWQRLSQDLDELTRILYYAVEPERIRRHQQLLDALNSRPAPPLELEGWVRMVDARWTLTPLSSAGSLMGPGGRFNIGADLEAAVRRPFPALYLAEDQATAYRERYQLEQGEYVDGLTPEELSLGVSTSTYRLRGRIERVFDVSNLGNLRPIANVLAKFSVPSEATAIAKRLKLPSARKLMIRTPEMLQVALQAHNWRVWPIQYELPGPSQLFGDLARAAGYEAIRYKSARHKSGYCLAILSGNIGSDRTWVELMDPVAPEVSHPRLDIDTADALAGWERLRSSQRPVHPPEA